jgi:hypothetical protein
MTFGNKMYKYNKNFPKIFGLSTFPLIAWTLGLFIISILFSIILKYFSLTNAIIITIILYWILLLTAEYIGYNLFSVHNIAASKYPGLPFINCLHAPLWMKIVYFSLGPIMIIVVTLINQLIK